MMKMKRCPFCGYEWIPRKQSVKSCPRCKRYLPWKKSKAEERR